MIQKAIAEDKEKVYYLWKSVFSFDDGGSIDYYFKNLYKDNNCYVIKNPEGIISTLCYNKHSLLLNGKRIKASFICGVVTAYAYRHQGYMNTLMKEVLEELECQELVTLIQAYNPKLYLRFGFEMVYFRKEYHLFSKQVKRCSLVGIEKIFSDEELVKLYREFMVYFDGYYMRDTSYYQNYRDELQAEGGKMIAYRNEEGILEGYMVYYLERDEIKIEEIQYLNSLAFLKLLNYAFDMRNEIRLSVSKDEAIELMIPDVHFQQKGFMMARINDYELFNRLYDVNVSNVIEAFALSGKPLYIRESW